MFLTVACKKQETTDTQLANENKTKSLFLTVDERGLVTETVITDATTLRFKLES